jgi:hypothetical protein
MYNAYLLREKGHYYMPLGHFIMFKKLTIKLL